MFSGLVNYDIASLALSGYSLVIMVIIAAETTAHRSTPGCKNSVRTPHVRSESV